MDDRLLTVEESLDYLRKIGKTKRCVKRDTFMSWITRGLISPVKDSPYRFDTRDLNTIKLPTPGARRGRPQKPLKAGERLDPDELVQRLEARSW